jgi:hypothetical protein
VVVSGHLAPIRLRLRPWQDDRTMRPRAETGTDLAASRSWVRRHRSMGTVEP